MRPKQYVNWTVLSIHCVTAAVSNLKHHLLTVAAKSWIKTLKQTIQYKKNSQMAYTNNCSELSNLVIEQ